MKRLYLAFLLFLSLSLSLQAQDPYPNDGIEMGHTFSICAVDPATGEVGSAGASCISGAIVISDMHPGVGVVHTQSYWHATNQNLCRDLMDLGYSPQQIMDSVVSADVQGNPGIRQYGAVDLVGGGRSAGYTGVNCFDYKNHVLGTTYAIQGNILLGQEILDSMEVRFNNTPGPLALRLMAALQGANVPGADTRCTSYGISSLSAFVRVARPGDTTGTYYLDLNVENSATHLEPIDSLQVLFDGWLATSAPEALATREDIRVYPNPSEGDLRIEHLNGAFRPGSEFRLYDNVGRLVHRSLVPVGKLHSLDLGLLPAGLYHYELGQPDALVKSGNLILR